VVGFMVVLQGESRPALSEENRTGRRFGGVWGTEVSPIGDTPGIAALPLCAWWIT
jgi:hypothetical protein